MIIFFLIISLILIIVFGYIIYNLLTKIEIYEELLEERDEWILEKKQLIEGTYLRLKELDKFDAVTNPTGKGLFESDDYVGTLFTDIVKLIEDFRNRIK